MKLSHLQDNILLKDTKELVAKERGVTTLILHHLREIDRRKLYSDLKCSSLFDYCTRELGYSESSAQRRIVAARLLDEIPEMEDKITSGKLTLTNISQVNSFFKESPTKVKVEVLGKIEGLSKRACEKKLFEITGKVESFHESQQRVSGDKVKVGVILTDETLKAMEELKDLLGNNLETDAVLLYALKAGKEKIEKDKFKQTSQPRSSLPLAKVSRYIPSKVKGDVYQRDKKCLNCGSKRNLHFDHRLPYALEGESSSENIRLLCSHCNQRARIRMRFSSA